MIYPFLLRPAPLLELDAGLDLAALFDVANPWPPTGFGHVVDPPRWCGRHRRWEAKVNVRRDDRNDQPPPWTALQFRLERAREEADRLSYARQPAAAAAMEATIPPESFRFFDSHDLAEYWRLREAGLLLRPRR